MLCASPDHQLVHVQAAVCGPQNRQYQTSGITCRIRDELSAAERGRVVGEARQPLKSSLAMISFHGETRRRIFAAFCYGLLPDRDSEFAEQAAQRLRLRGVR